MRVYLLLAMVGRCAQVEAALFLWVSGVQPAGGRVLDVSQVHWRMLRTTPPPLELLRLWPGFQQLPYTRAHTPHTSIHTGHIRADLQSHPQCAHMLWAHTHHGLWHWVHTQAPILPREGTGTLPLTQDPHWWIIRGDCGDNEGRRTGTQRTRGLPGGQQWEAWLVTLPVCPLCGQEGRTLNPHQVAGHTMSSPWQPSAE